jgi:hypothetical protein
MKNSYRQPPDLNMRHSLITVSPSTIETSIKPDGQTVLPVSNYARRNVMPKLNVVAWNGTRADGMDQNAI